jgi:hypothetical protein
MNTDDKNADPVQIQEISENQIRVTMNNVSTDVFVERRYRLMDHFGVFTSLDDVIQTLRAIQVESES